MKRLLTFLTVTMLNAAFLYPLFMSGIGRPLSWLIEVALAGGGGLGLYLLVRYRREL